MRLNPSSVSSERVGAESSHFREKEISTSSWRSRVVSSTINIAKHPYNSTIEFISSPILLSLKSMNNKCEKKLKDIHTKITSLNEEIKNAATPTQALLAQSELSNLKGLEKSVRQKQLKIGVVNNHAKIAIKCLEGQFLTDKGRESINDDLHTIKSYKQQTTKSKILIDEINSNRMNAASSFIKA